MMLQVDETATLATDKINGLLESFMGINDTELGEFLPLVGLGNARLVLTASGQRAMDHSDGGGNHSEPENRTSNPPHYASALR